MNTKFKKKSILTFIYKKKLALNVKTKPRIAEVSYLGLLRAWRYIFTYYSERFSHEVTSLNFCCKLPQNLILKLEGNLVRLGILSSTILK